MAKKPKFHFNPETLSYERIENTLKTKLKNVSTHLLVGVLMGLMFFAVFVIFFKSPGERSALEGQKQLEAQYRVLNRNYAQMQEVLTDLQQRDDNLYRVIYQAEPVPYDVRHGGVEASNLYKEMSEMTNSKIILSIALRADSLAHQLVTQSKSYDEIALMISQKEERMLAIPAIQPILNKDLSRTASGYGMRIDPVYAVPKFHAGMDFSAPTGTDIFATGGGVIKSAGWQQGYGNCVVVNHGFGYETLYGHMDKILAHAGQKVVRGDIIGLVGSTGKSTGPHLHYEVHLRGQIMNPQNYYFMDLSPEEYDDMLQRAANHGQVYD
jgi:murein DD-endopeptidase MepM/ murein hydrolase activator NlpD